MGYGDDYWGLYKDYYRDPFPHSLLDSRFAHEALRWRLGSLRLRGLVFKGSGLRVQGLGVQGFM